MKRACETPEEYKRRLEDMRERSKQKRMKESPEQYQVTL
jgi:hypothetical protein